MIDTAPQLIQVALADMRRDGGTQSRSALNSATAARYAEDYRLGARFPEPVLFYGPDDREGAASNGRNFYWLAAGFHRYEAFDQNGVRAVVCKVFEGGCRAAILYSVGENYKHGLLRSPVDKRHAVRLLLTDREWCQKSDTWIAEKCHVSPTLVGTVRRELMAEWQLCAPSPALVEQQPVPSGDATQNVPAASPPVGEASLSTVDSDNGLSADSVDREEPSLSLDMDPSAPRLSRSRHGGTRTVRTAGIGGGNKGKVKPVIVETETREIAKKMAQIVRSIPKAVRQAKALGWTLERMIEETRTVWQEIPVEDERQTEAS